MGRTRRQPEPSDNVAVAEPLTTAEAAKVMDRFRVLTGRLLTVSREQLAAEERRYQAEKPQKRSGKKRRR